MRLCLISNKNQIDIDSDYGHENYFQTSGYNRLTIPLRNVLILSPKMESKRAGVSEQGYKTHSPK